MPQACENSMNIDVVLRERCRVTLLGWKWLCCFPATLGQSCPICPKSWLSTWTGNSTQPHKLGILLIVISIKIQALSHLPTCWSQMWCCGGYCTVSQLCHLLGVTLVVRHSVPDRCGVFSCWKHSQFSCQSNKSRKCVKSIESHQKLLEVSQYFTFLCTSHSSEACLQSS